MCPYLISVLVGLSEYCFCLERQTLIMHEFFCVYISSIQLINRKSLFNKALMVGNFQTQGDLLAVLNYNSKSPFCAGFFQFQRCFEFHYLKHAWNFLDLQKFKFLCK